MMTFKELLNEQEDNQQEREKVINKIEGYTGIYTSWKEFTLPQLKKLLSLLIK